MRRENMHDNIKAQEKSLDSIFSGNYVFSVPSYQRPYSWTKDNAAELFDDLFDAYQNKTSEGDSYFLGSLVLKKDPYKPNSDIIDGQQRLTTITILLAILRDQLAATKEDQPASSSERDQLASPKADQGDSKKEDEKYKKYAEDINKRICLTDDVFNRVEDVPLKYKYILKIREKDDNFFCDYIKERPEDKQKDKQKDKQEDNEEDKREDKQEDKREDKKEDETSSSGYPDKPTDAMIRIIENKKILWEKIFNLTKEEKTEFANFILKNCYFVVVETPNEESAFRIFSVLNARGLSLTVADLLKAELISSIPDNEQGQFTKKWEDYEVALGRSDFANLFSYIRMIYAKDKLHKTLLKEFHEYVIDVKNENSKAPFKNAEDFIGNALREYVAAYKVIKNCSYKDEGEENNIHFKNKEEKDRYFKYKGPINRCFKYLNRLDNSDWLPPAIEVMKYYKFRCMNKDKDEFLLQFLKKFERLAYGQFILRTTVNNRIKRYGKLLNSLKIFDVEITDAAKIDFITNLKDSPLKLTTDEKVQIKKILKGDIYDKPAIRLPLLLRLDEFLSTGSATYDYKTISIEHVLPQTSDNIESWTQAFPDEEIRAKWVNKLANLVLLNGRTNSSAQNYDFETKKEKYFKTKNGNISGVTNFALTSQVIQKNEWTPEVLEKRQKELLSTFYAIWDLNSEDS